MKFVGRLLVSHRQHVELGAVSHAGELLECLLCLYRQAVQLSDHELHDVVGVAFGVNAIQVPHPAAFTVAEAEQAFLSQSGNELDGEEGIARSLLMNQVSRAERRVPARSAESPPAIDADRLDRAVSEQCPPLPLRPDGSHRACVPTGAWR